MPDRRYFLDVRVSVLVDARLISAVETLNETRGRAID